MREDICQAAVELWGTDMQLDMVIEECSELIQAITKYKRSGDKERAVVFVAEEHADVLIMLDQLSYMMEEHDSTEHKSYRELRKSFTKDKVNRLVNRIDAAETERAKKAHLENMCGGGSGGAKR